ncbi:MAG TPA: Fe-S protein assembly co-chaperone HscB [Burkholderiales bacterium]|nr:Fe-S protein assembly co-chaperone HscB [Burkholderiales bacterium]
MWLWRKFYYLKYLSNKRLTIKNHEFQDILNKNYFEVFGFKEIFLINTESLRQAYLKLQKQFHPDYFISDKNLTINKDIIIAISAHINNAYKTLLNPLSRAILLLNLHDIAYNLNNDTSISETFIIEQMEIHEEIEEAKTTKNLVALENIEEKIKTKKNIIVDNLNIAFTHISKQNASNDYKGIKKLIEQLAFYDKLEHLVNNSIHDII